MIPIHPNILLDENEIRFEYTRASGPGGQHVNKVSTAVQLRFDAAGSPSLPPDVKARLLRLAGSRATKEGGIVISASRFSSQKKNRDDAVARLVDLVARAAVKPRFRVKTRPSASSRRRRLEDKHQQSEKKGFRKPVSPD